MAPGAPQTSPKDVWNKHEQRIENLIKQGYSQLKGENYSAALEAVRTKFFSNYSEKIWFPSLVDHVVKGFIREKRQQLWDAHKALVISNVQEAIPPSAREFQSYYTELLLKLISKQFEASFPESRPAENFVDWFQEFVKQLIDTAIQSGKLGDEELFPDDADCGRDWTVYVSGSLYPVSVSIRSTTPSASMSRKARLPTPLRLTMPTLWPG